MSLWNWVLLLGVTAIWVGMASAVAYMTRAPEPEAAPETGGS